MARVGLQRKVLGPVAQPLEQGGTGLRQPGRGSRRSKNIGIAARMMLP